MRTTRGLDRLVFFTDAVIAIAIMLLVLPLVDSVSQAAHSGLGAEEFIGDNLAAISGFVLSFVVIARLWVAHHSTFEHVRSYNHPFLWLNLFWLFTVVVLPLPTEMVSQFKTSPLTVGIYVGTMTASSLTLTSLTLLIRKHPQLELEGNPVSDSEVFANVATTIAFFIALVVGVLVPVINFYALLVILLTIPAQWIYKQRSNAPHGSRVRSIADGSASARTRGISARP